MEFFINITAPAQFFRVIIFRFVRYQNNGLVGSYAGFSVFNSRIQAPVTQVAFGSDNKESPLLVQVMKSREIDIAFIHGVDGIFSYGHRVKHAYIVNLGWGGGNIGWNCTSKIEKRMHFYPGFS